MPKEHSSKERAPRDYTVAFWIVLILLLLLLVAAIIVGMVQSSKTPQVIDGQFRFQNQSAHNHLSETGEISYFVHMTYGAKVDNSKIASRSDVLNIINTCPSLITATSTDPWERVAQDIANQIWSSFNCYGVSVELVIPLASADHTGNTTITATFSKGYINRAIRLDLQPYSSSQ